MFILPLFNCVLFCDTGDSAKLKEGTEETDGKDIKGCWEVAHPPLPERCSKYSVDTLQESCPDLNPYLTTRTYTHLKKELNWGQGTDCAQSALL